MCQTLREHYFLHYTNVFRVQVYYAAKDSKKRLFGRISICLRSQISIKKMHGGMG